MEKTNYGNWVPRKLLILSFIAVTILIVLTLVFALVMGNIAITVILGIATIVFLSLGIYMTICYHIFSFTGGALMGKVHQNLINHLPFNGNGDVLDIGCGSGALTIRCAKTYPKAKLTGIDYWGVNWSYSKGMCINNAKIEGVADRITFLKGDAANLPFESDSFDAAVSNFVFHEVKTAKDKRDVVKEALRVVKKGGAFCFQDLFSQKKLYGDMDTFISELKKDGITEVHFIANAENVDNLIPKFVRAPWMITGMGVLYGKK